MSEEVGFKLKPDQTTALADIVELKLHKYMEK
jgi:hypothetical protein